MPSPPSASPPSAGPPSASPPSAGSRALAITLGSATLHEASGQRGALPSRIAPVDASMTVCGEAFPVTCAAGDNLSLHRAIYAAAHGDVLVVDAAGAEEFGYFGEVMARAAMARGIAGLVIAGGVRDANRIAALGFPVFATRRCIRGTTKRPGGPGDLGAPVVLGGVVIRRGDVVVGDGDGVVVIAAGDFPAVLDAGQAREAKEAEVFSRIAAGETTLAIYGLP